MSRRPPRSALRNERRSARRRDERGLVLPTRLMVFSISVVVLAGLAFVATQHDDSPDVASTVGTSRTTTTPTDPATTVPVTPSSTPRPKPVVRRGKVLVEVYNNSNVTGLAGKTGGRAQRAGWDVVGTDNWYGTVDASTVYYGAHLKAAGTLLARDLGITKVKPAAAPMRADRLTVILTGDYAN
jgi:hypothetical protein